MAWLSDVPINPFRRRGRDLLDNPHVAHGMVAQGLVGPDRERTLWRLEYDERRAHLIVLTQSRPSWAHVVEAAGWEDADGSAVRVFDLSPLLDRIAVGRVFSFRVRVNPVMATQRPTGADLQGKLERRRQDAGGRVRGVLAPQRTAAQQTEWFLGHSAQWGFEVPPLRGELADTEQRDLILDERRTLRFRKGGGGGHPITLSTATFAGHLTVTDPDRLRKSVLEGVGRAKAYGCGLITLGRPRMEQDA